MSCNTKTSLAAVIDAVNAQLNNNYVDRDDPRINQGVFTEPTIRGGLMLDEAAKLDFCGYVTECGQREPFGKQWIDRPLYPDNTLVSYEDGGEIKSRWQDIDDVVAGTEIGESYTAYEETRSLGLQGYTIIDSFELGATITQRGQALRHAATGKLYRWAGDLPKNVPAGSTPDSSGGVDTNAWLEVSDTALRQEILTGGLITDTFVMVTPDFVGAVPRSLRDVNTDSLNIKTFGGVSDYSGVAEYDGNDSTRITATDNTESFNALINAAIQTGQNTVKIGAGHWGIKVGQLQISNFDKLKIVGEGVDITTIDFIREDDTKSSYVSPLTANFIANFSEGNLLEFADITIKATTKSGVVSGPNTIANSAAVYYGAVWGFVIFNVKNVVFNNVKAERFNYRGFSVYGLKTESVTLNNCKGFHNTSSGFWVEHAKNLTVNGGEFAYNGIFGNQGTGYGVTASSKVGVFTVKNGAHFHHNYRKGVDSHGCSSFNVTNSVFENNVLSHVAYPNTYGHPDILDYSANVSRNVFANGETSADRLWLKNCYDALLSNGFDAATGVIFSVTETPANPVKISSVDFIGNHIKCHYNGVSDTAMVGAKEFISIQTPSAVVKFKDNTVGLEYAAMPEVSDIYSQIIMTLYAKELTIDDNGFEYLTDSSYTNSVSEEVDTGALFAFPGAEKNVEITNNKFKLNNILFSTATGGGGIRNPISWTASTSKRVLKDNHFSYTNSPYESEDRLNDAYFMGVKASYNVPLQQSNNTFERAGAWYYIQSKSLSDAFSEFSYNTGVKAIGERVMMIVLDKTYGNTLIISTNDGSPDLVINNPLSTFVMTATNTNESLEFDSRSLTLVENGITKLAVFIKAKKSINGDVWGSVRLVGGKPSLGIERIVTY